MPNEAGRELDALIASKIMGWTEVNNRGLGTRNDWPQPVQDVIPGYSTSMNAAWKVVDKIHEGIDPAEMGPYQYLTLVCTGAFGERWAASFDFNLSHDWYEADMIVGCPFAARAATPAHAICLAALKAVGVEVTE